MMITSILMLVPLYCKVNMKYHSMTSYSVPLYIHFSSLASGSCVSYDCFMIRRWSFSIIGRVVCLCLPSGSWGKEAIWGACHTGRTAFHLRLGELLHVRWKCFLTVVDGLNRCVVDGSVDEARSRYRLGDSSVCPKRYFVRGSLYETRTHIEGSETEISLLTQS